MAYEENLRSFSADADASVGIYTGVPGLPGSASPNGGKQYFALRLTGKNQVGLVAAAGGVGCIGVLQNKPQRPGAPCTVGYQGISFCTAGGVINAGDNVTVDINGRFVTNTTPSATSVTVGVAMAPTAGTVGELFPVLLQLT